MRDKGRSATRVTTHGNQTHTGVHPPCVCAHRLQAHALPHQVRPAFFRPVTLLASPVVATPFHVPSIHAAPLQIGHLSPIVPCVNVTSRSAMKAAFISECVSNLSHWLRLGRKTIIRCEQGHGRCSGTHVVGAIAGSPIFCPRSSRRSIIPF
jgi:hypothetical protein